MTLEEWSVLLKGASVPGAHGGERVPLYAGGGDPGETKPDKDAIMRNFPAAVHRKFK